MLILLLLAALAAPRPSASAGEIPELADLLARAGWTPTPELSGIFAPGRIFEEVPGQGHQQRVSDCYGVTPVRATYTQAEVTSQLQAGVRVRLGLGSVGSSGALEKKVSFGTPAHLSVPLLEVEPTPACQRALARIGDPSRFYIVTEVLLAEILEQTCGRIDAGGRFVGLGEAEAKTTMGCSMDSLEPVAVAYRVQPLSALLAPGARAADPTVEGDFQVVDLGVQQKLKEQDCGRAAQGQAEQERSARLSASASTARNKATVAWASLQPQAEACAQLQSAADRQPCAAAVEGWMRSARALKVQLPAGEEEVKTSCGLRKVAVPERSEAVAVAELAAAEQLLERLKKGGPPAAPAAAAGSPLTIVPGKGVAGLVIGQTTVAQAIALLGEDCRLRDYGARNSERPCSLGGDPSSADDITYDYTALGKYEPSRKANSSRPYEIDFRDGVVHSIHIAVYQRELKTAEGFQTNSSKSEVLAAWGRPDREKPGDPLDIWYYDRRGVEVWVYPEEDRVNSLHLSPAR